MINLKDKILVLVVLATMVILSFTYIIITLITALFIISEVESDKSVTITIVNYNTTEVKETIIEEPNKEVSVVPETKPEVKTPVEQPKQDPVVTEKPKAETAKSDDAYLLAQIINAEANDEPYNGKLAVGNVVMNRVNHPDFPDTIRDVIYQKGQFQPVRNGSINKKPSDDSIKAANEALNGKQIVGKQALYFYNPEISTSDWIFTRKTIMDIGNHRFAY